MRIKLGNGLVDSQTQLSHYRAAHVPRHSTVSWVARLENNLHVVLQPCFVEWQTNKDHFLPWLLVKRMGRRGAVFFKSAFCCVQGSWGNVHTHTHTLTDHTGCYHGSLVVPVSRPLWVLVITFQNIPEHSFQDSGAPSASVQRIVQLFTKEWWSESPFLHFFPLGYELREISVSAREICPQKLGAIIKTRL